MSIGLGIVDNMFMGDCAPGMGKDDLEKDVSRIIWIFHSFLMETS